MSKGSTKKKHTLLSVKEELMYLLHKEGGKS